MDGGDEGGNGQLLVGQSFNEAGLAYAGPSPEEYWDTGVSARGGRSEGN